MTSAARVADRSATNGSPVNWTCWWTLAVFSAIGYLFVARVSRAFALGTTFTERPIPLILVTFGLLFLCYLLALAVLLRQPSTIRLAAIVWLTSLVFRLIQLPAVPIQEVDIYRYVWDGAVASAGVNPYCYAPQDVSQAVAGLQVGRTPSEIQLATLADLVNGDEALQATLRAVHYGQLTTPYPPISQLVFAATASLMPEGSSVAQRLNALKCVLMAFDMGTLTLVMVLLAWSRCHLGLSLTYGWCPLVIKELANSGHLDAIAIFFTTLAMTAAVRSMRRPIGEDVDGSRLADSTLTYPWLSMFTTTLALCLAIGSKLYPIVLTPLMISLWWHQGGRALALSGTLVLFTGTVLCLAPMLIAPERTPRAAEFAIDGRLLSGKGEATAPSTAESLPPPPGLPDQDFGKASPPATPQTPAAHHVGGLYEFVKRWEMNDFLFLILVENLRSHVGAAPEYCPWFAIIPHEWTQPVLARWSELVRTVIGGAAHWGLVRLDHDSLLVELTKLEENPFIASSLLARCMVATILLVVACVIAWRTGRAAASSADWLRAAFLILVWCWLLAPTQNPWYLCWALPFLPFARSRVWLLLSGVTFLYYLRFWLEYHYPQTTVWGTPYHGREFFHFVVVWLEFGPWFLCLVCASIARVGFQNREKIQRRAPKV